MSGNRKPDFIDGISLNSRIDEFGNKLALEVLPTLRLETIVDT